MNKILILILSVFIIGCNANEIFIHSKKPDFENTSFDVVEKRLIIEPELPSNVQDLITYYFNEKVKIDGFEGNMIFTISKFIQEVSQIDDGKRVDLILNFNVYLNKPSLSKIKIIEGQVSSYGTLTGDFSLKEFDTVINNTQADLVLRLSRDLKSKI